MKGDKPKLAVISTYDELCGIASYARAIVRQLSPWFDITVFDLDQYVFRHRSRRIRKMANLEIERICKELKGFDCVNVQLEHGIFGRNKRDAYRRICRIIAAAPRLCITFHTVFDSEGTNWKAVRAMLSEFQLGKAWTEMIGSRQESSLLGQGIYSAIRRAQWRKKVSVVVHTRREAKTMKLVERISNVYDHPLAYYSDADAQGYTAKATRDGFPLLGSLGKDDVLLGCFGFTGSYKGIDTALRALHLLPDNYHLAIFGGVHPEAIQQGVPLDPYIAELLRVVSPGRSWLEDIGTGHGKAISLTTSVDDLLRLARTRHVSDISRRTHFMGPMSDDQFPHAMAVCDAVLLPYLEVGQSASGPMSMAVNLNRPVIATRTKTFMQFSRYYPGRVELFDIGNFLQLSQIIESGMFRGKSVPRTENQPDTSTNVETYRKALFATAAT